MTRYFDHYNRPLTRDEYYKQMCLSKNEAIDYLWEVLADETTNMTDGEAEDFIEQAFIDSFEQMPLRYEDDEPRYVGVCDANHF